MAHVLAAIVHLVTLITQSAMVIASGALPASMASACTHWPLTMARQLTA